MPIPLIIAGVAAGVGALAGIAGREIAKEAKDKMGGVGRRHKENIIRFEKTQVRSTAMMDALGRKELEVLGGFEKLFQLIEKIHYKPAFYFYDNNGLRIPKYNAGKLKKVSVGAEILLGGLESAAVGTAGGFAAAGAATAAIMALGAAYIDGAVSEIPGVAAEIAALDAIGGGAVATGCDGRTLLGSTILSGGPFGVGLLGGGIIFSIAGASLSDNADEAWRQMERAEEEINKICKFLEMLDATAKRYYKALVIVKKIYADYIDKLARIIETDGKTYWNVFSKEEKHVTETTILLVGLLFDMCKVQVVFSSGNSTETNRINVAEINKKIVDAGKLLGKFLGMKGLDEDALARLVPEGAAELYPTP